MRLRPYIPEKDFEMIKDWITDPRTHALWCANRFDYPLCEKNFEEVLRDMKYRDENDAGRKDAPLRRADDAILLDTTATNLDESFRLLCGIIERQMKR